MHARLRSFLGILISRELLSYWRNKANFECCIAVYHSDLKSLRLMSKARAGEVVLTEKF